MLSSATSVVILNPLNAEDFLKIEYFVVHFLKHLSSACFLWEMMD